MPKNRVVHYFGSFNSCFSVLIYHYIFMHIKHLYNFEEIERNFFEFALYIDASIIFNVSNKQYL